MGETCGISCPTKHEKLCHLSCSTDGQGQIPEPGSTSMMSNTAAEHLTKCFICFPSPSPTIHPQMAAGDVSWETSMATL